jgi:hypothetical protein
MKASEFERWKAQLKQDGYDVDNMELLDLISLINEYKLASIKEAE